MKVSSTSILVHRWAYMPYFKINAPIFCCSLFFEDYLNSQVRINKMGNEHTVNYHPSPSKLTSRIDPSMFLRTPKRFNSREYLLKFSQPVYISHQPWLRKTGPFMKWRPGGHGHHFSWNRKLPGMFSWKFAFVSLSKTSKTFLPGILRISSGTLRKFQIYGVKIPGRDIWEPKN